MITQFIGQLIRQFVRLFSNWLRQAGLFQQRQQALVSRLSAVEDNLADIERQRARAVERAGLRDGATVEDVDAAIDHLRRFCPGKKCYVFGTRSFLGQLRDAGIPVTHRLEDDVDILLCGFDRELTFRKLEDACILLNRGVTWLATNPDWVCPTWYGSVPDCGSVCRMLTTATGREPLFLGKPKPAMAELALRRTGFAPEQAVIIGDRLYTDIACGVNAGIDSIFVLSGEGTEADIAQYGIHPTWIFSDIAALYRQLEETL